MVGIYCQCPGCPQVCWSGGGNEGDDKTSFFTGQLLRRGGTLLLYVWNFYRSAGQLLGLSHIGTVLLQPLNAQHKFVGCVLKSSIIYLYECISYY